MSYQAEAFRQFASTRLQPNVVNTYSSFIKRIDLAVGGLDEALSSQGASGVMMWAESTDAEPLRTYRSTGKSALRQYVAFFGSEPASDLDISGAADDMNAGAFSEAVSAAFSLERTMQAAVRRSIDNLEPGITIIDGGVERTVATGKIDILAGDASGMLTVVELKAGQAPAGSVEQALGYAEALAEEEGEPTGAILVASAFSERQLAAAKRMNGLKLVRYDYSVTFSEVEY
jgi:hypothetical protein